MDWVKYVVKTVYIMKTKTFFLHIKKTENLERGQKRKRILENAVSLLSPLTFMYCIENISIAQGTLVYVFVYHTYR